MIEMAVRLISEQGVASLSIAEVARAMEIDRTTVYYHFKSRDALVQEVKAWASAQLSKAFDFEAPLEERIDYTTRYVLENSELVKLWIDDFIAVGDIRKSFPFWDKMIEGFRPKSENSEHPIDAEVYFINLLTSAIIGPRVFKNSVLPSVDIETVVRRFRVERLRLLGTNG
ncbi:MAG: helix-turn-helix domain-containing protein [Sphingomicrobium sp.]